MEKYILFKGKKLPAMPNTTGLLELRLCVMKSFYENYRIRNIYVCVCERERERERERDRESFEGKPKNEELKK